MNEGQSKQYRDQVASKLKDVRNLDKDLAQKYQEKVAKTPEYKAARDEKVITHKQEIAGISQEVEITKEKMEKFSIEEREIDEEIRLLVEKKDEIHNNKQKQEKLLEDIKKYLENYDFYKNDILKQLDWCIPYLREQEAGGYNPGPREFFEEEIHRAELFMIVCEKNNPADYQIIKEKNEKLWELLHDVYIYE